MAKDHPILGFGPRNSNLFSQQYGADMENRAIHSQYLQVAADTGFVGMSLYLLLLFTVWQDVKRVRRWAKTQTGEDARRVYAMAAGVEASMAVFCAGAVFLSLEVFELPYLLLMIGAKLGILCGHAAPATASTFNETAAAEFWSAPPVARQV
jgi:O-antigen ligase